MTASRRRVATAAARALMLAAGLSAAARAHAQVSPPAARPLGLSEALAYAEAHYPSVQAALAERVAASKDVDVARTAYLPQVSLLWQINRATINNITGVLLPQGVVPSISGPVLPANSQTAWNSGAGALVTWRPYDFGYRAAKVDAARASETAADQWVIITRLDVLDATLNAFMNVAAAQSLARVAEANVDRLGAFAKAVHVLVDNRLKPGVDAEQADAAEALARTALVSARANVDVQRATLAKLVDRPGAALAIDASSLEVLPATAEPAPAPIEGHPAARAEAAKVRQQAAELRALGSAYAPQIDLVGGAWTRGGGKTGTGVYAGGDAGLWPDVNNWAVGVQVSVPLGSFPSLHFQQEARRARLEAERDRYQQTLDDLSERLAQAHTELKSAQEIAAITPVALRAARDGEQQQRARFQSGLATVVDVTAAEAALAQAESQDAIARINVWRALGALAAAEGDLQPFRRLVSR